MQSWRKVSGEEKILRFGKLRALDLSFILGDSSFLIFRVINQQHGDLAWLPDAYFDFEYYVNKKHVVNDAAERAIGLVKPHVPNFKKEENFQAAMKTIEVARAR